MEWFLIGIVLLFVVTVIKYLLYRREIGDICRQIEFLLGGRTNKRIQTQLCKREIVDLADKINRMADRQEAESLSIKKKEQQLKETLTNISHDIRTPLTSLKGFFELYTQEEDLGKKEYYGRTIRERMDDLSVLLEELFTYTKLQNESYELVLKRQDFTKLVLDSLFSFYEQWKEMGICPGMSVEEGSAMVLCSDIAVKRILTNVLRNAVVHGDGDISIRYEIREDSVLFCCGNGYDKEAEPEAERVFERFYKGDSARRETSSGLGLSIARELTLRMGGEMGARVEDGRFLVEIRMDRERFGDEKTYIHGN